MAYIKSILVGLAVAAVAMIAWVFGEMALIVMPQIKALKPQDGSGGIGAVVVTSYVPYVGLAAFAMGFYLMLRRLKSRGIASDQDWRLTGQDKYLTGVTLIRRQWREPRPGWDHDHCEFCLEKFGDERLGDVLREGWTTPDEYRWICDECFSDFKDQFKWRVQETTN